MGMNYYEKIVMDDKEKEGYDVIRIDKGGFPDFKVFDFRNGERFWLEVKRPPEFYTDLQKKEFLKLGAQLIIALVEKGKITYKDYKTGQIISTSSYSKMMPVNPNVTCDRCKHTWFTTSKMFFVSCPSCSKKVKIKEFKEVVENEAPQGTNTGV